MVRAKEVNTGIESSNSQGSIWINLDSTGGEIGIVTKESAIYMRIEDFPSFLITGKLIYEKNIKRRG